MKPLKDLVSEVFDEQDFKFNFIQKRGSQVKLEVQNLTEVAEIVLNVNSTYARGPEVFLFNDPNTPNSVIVVTQTEISKYDLGVAATIPLVLSSKKISFYSEELEAVFQLNLEAQRLEFVAQASAAPVVISESFYINGILSSNNHLVPISAILNLDSSLVNTSSLEDFGYDYSQSVLPYLDTERLADRTNVRDFRLKNLRQQEIFPPTVTASLDKSGTMILFSTASPMGRVLGMLVNLSTYFETEGSQFQNLASPILLPKTSELNLRNCRTTVLEDTHGFTIIASDSEQSEVYFVDRSSFSSLQTTGISVLEPMTLGYRYWTQSPSETEKFLISPGESGQCLVVRTELLDSRTPHKFTTSTIIDNYENIYFSTSTDFYSEQRSLKSDLSLDEALSLALYGQPLQKALEYRTKSLQEHQLLDNVFITEESRQTTGRVSREISVAKLNPKRVSEYTSIVQLNGQQNSLRELSYLPYRSEDETILHARNPAQKRLI